MMLSPLLSQNPLLSKSAETTIRDSVKNSSVSSKSPNFVNRLKLQILQLQRKIYRTLYKQKNQIKEGKNLLFPLLIAFLYGLIHALGPGHGKLFLTGYFLANRSTLNRSFFAGFITGFMHAFSGIILVIILYFFLHTSIATSSEMIRDKFEIVSWSILLLIGCYSLYSSFKPHHNHKQPKSLYGLVISIGLIPCPGAVMISVFGISVLNNFLYTLMMIIALGFGMGLIISLFALIPTISMRIKNPVTISDNVWKGLSITGSILIIILALSLILARV